MGDFLSAVGEVFLILASLGLIAVVIFLAMTALRLKTTVVTNAGRLYKRPLASGKNLFTTIKGIAQQETVRGKRIAATVKGTAGVVKDSATHIRGSVQSVHPEDLKPTLTTLSNLSKMLKVAAQITQAASKQKAR